MVVLAQFNSYIGNLLVCSSELSSYITELIMLSNLFLRIETFEDRSWQCVGFEITKPFNRHRFIQNFYSTCNASHYGISKGRSVAGNSFFITFKHLIFWGISVCYFQTFSIRVWSNFINEERWRKSLDYLYI